MDPELPKTLTFAADAAKKAHDLITVLEEEFSKLKGALSSAASLMGNAHTAVLAQGPQSPEAPVYVSVPGQAIPPVPVEAAPVESHQVFPNPNLHEH